MSKGLGTSERRLNIMIVLYRRRYEKTKNLAKEFGVSERTVRRDIDIISIIAPIYTKGGKYGGGVYVMDNCHLDIMYFTSQEQKVLRKVLDCIEKCQICSLSQDDIFIFKNMIIKYTKPMIYK